MERHKGLRKCERMNQAGEWRSEENTSGEVGQANDVVMKVCERMNRTTKVE